MPTSSMTDPSVGDTLAALWRRIECWTAAQAPQWLGLGGAYPLFNASASASSLDQLETRLGLVLPPAYRALLRCHDGCRAGDYPLPMRATAPTAWRTLAAAEVGPIWERLCALAADRPYPHGIRTEGPVRAQWWNRGWIPAATAGTGDLVCVDTDPAPGGAPAQLLLYEHDFAERRRLFPSLVDWLRECADDLEGGAYAYVDGLGLCLPTADDDPAPG